MKNLILGVSLERIVRAVVLRERLAAGALEKAGVLYAVVGKRGGLLGFASMKPPRNTQDVDLLRAGRTWTRQRRPRGPAGFIRRHAASIDMFWTGPRPRADAIHVISLGKSSAGIPLIGSPDVAESEVRRHSHCQPEAWSDEARRFGTRTVPSCVARSRPADQTWVIRFVLELGRLQLLLDTRRLNAHRFPQVMRASCTSSIGLYHGSRCPPSVLRYQCRRTTRGAGRAGLNMVGGQAAFLAADDKLAGVVRAAAADDTMAST